MKEVDATQESLAEQFEMTPGGMQKWLAGTRQPTLDDINRIADELKCPRSWLTHGIEPEDMVDGLADAPKASLRRLIKMERAQPLPSAFWAAIMAMADTVAPPPTAHIKRDDDPRTGTEG